MLSAMKEEFLKMKVYAIFIILLLSVGCTKDPALLSVHEPIHFSASINLNTEVQSRTSMNKSTASFISGDKIGIFDTLAKRNNVLFSYNGTAWSTTTPMYWSSGTSSHIFYAYYPYRSANQGMKVTIPILNNQVVSTVPDTACDMLIAGPKTQTRIASVPLTFTHAFALLQFNVTTSLVTTYSLKSVVLQGGNTAGGTAGYGIVNIVNGIGQIGYDFIAGKVTVTAANNNSTTYSQTLTKTIPSPGILGGLVPITIYALVLPGQYANPVLSVKFIVSPLIGADKPTTTVNLQYSTLAAGSKYIYDVQIGNAIIGTTNPNIHITKARSVPLDTPTNP